MRHLGKDTIVSFEALEVNANGHSASIPRKDFFCVCVVFGLFIYYYDFFFGGAANVCPGQSGPTEPSIPLQAWGASNWLLGAHSIVVGDSQPASLGARHVLYTHFKCKVTYTLMQRSIFFKTCRLMVRQVERVG